LISKKGEGRGKGAHGPKRETSEGKVKEEDFIGTQKGVEEASAKKIRKGLWANPRKKRKWVREGEGTPWSTKRGVRGVKNKQSMAAGGKNINQSYGRHAIGG